MPKYLEFDEFVERLEQAGWRHEDAVAEANRNFDGDYDETDEID